MACVVCNGSEAASEEDVEDDAQEAKDANATEAQSEDNREEGVENTGARHALNSLLPGWDRHIVLRKDSEEIGINAEDDGGTCEFENAKASGRDAEHGTAESHGEK